MQQTDFMPHHSQGILRPEQAPFTLQRFQAGAKVSQFVEFFWVVNWELEQGDTYLSQNLPYPCTHLVFEQDHSAVVGPMTGVFNKQLMGCGKAIGARFYPGAFWPFYQQPVSTLANKRIAIADCFSDTVAIAEEAILKAKNAESSVAIFEECLVREIGQKPASWLSTHKQQRIKLAQDLVNAIANVEDLLRVDDLAKAHNLTIRTVERLFNQFIGISAKQVIRQYRLQQLADVLINSDGINWSATAVQLGYADQAHCIRDFKLATGKTPTQLQSEQ